MKKHIHIDCDNCGTMTETKMRNFKIPRLGKTYELNVMAEVCPNCDNAYIPGKKVEAFEKSIKNKEIVAA